MAAGGHHRRGQEVEPPRPRRRRLPDRVKWCFLPKDAKTRLPGLNADESEPGTCKDRELLDCDPHLLIEGMVIAVVRARLQARVHLHPRRDDARGADPAGGRSTRPTRPGSSARSTSPRRGAVQAATSPLHRGAGAYICGEETALLNSLEGKRGWPRLKPPFPAVKGLFGSRPSSTTSRRSMNVPDIIEKGGEWFAELGIGKSGGTRIVCVSGHVNKPGVYELPMGIPFRELIYDVCGGMPGGRKLKGAHPGRHLDAAARRQRARRPDRVRRAHDRPAHQGRRGQARACRSTWAAAAGCKTMAGSGGVVVFDDSTDVVALCARIMKFYAHESLRPVHALPRGHGLAGAHLPAPRATARAGRATSSCWPTIAARHRRQHHLRAGRRGGLADARLPHQVPRRLRGASLAEQRGARPLATHRGRSRCDPLTGRGPAER